MVNFDNKNKRFWSELGVQTKIIEKRWKDERRIIKSLLLALQDDYKDLLNEIFSIFKYGGDIALHLKIIISKEKKEDENYIKIEFRDNGQGIPDSMKDQVFDRSSKEKGGKGLGFGLSLVKRIMESYGGKIWVEDRIIGDYSQGSNFILLIPGVS